MSRVLAFILLWVLPGLGALPAAGQDQPAAGQDQPAAGQDQTEPKPDLRISASLSMQPLLAAMGRVLREQRGLQIEITSHLTSVEDLDDLANGNADLAFITKPLAGTDRARYPDMDLVAVPIGMQVVALGISDDIWDAGVRTISEKSMQDIYEQKITNWKALGGPDEKVTLYSFEEGGGVWEIFATWLYGDARKAPLPKVEKVANSQDARDALEFTPGAFAPIGASLVDGDRCHALGLNVAGKVATPTPATVSSGAYPLVRPMLGVCNGRPTLNIRAVTEFLTGADGQKLIKSSGAMGLDAVPPAPAPDYEAY